MSPKPLEKGLALDTVHTQVRPLWSAPATPGVSEPAQVTKCGSSSSRPPGKCFGLCWPRAKETSGEASHPRGVGGQLCRQSSSPDPQDPKCTHIVKKPQCGPGDRGRVSLVAVACSGLRSACEHPGGPHTHPGAGTPRDSQGTSVVQATCCEPHFTVWHATATRACSTPSSRTCLWMPRKKGRGGALTPARRARPPRAGGQPFPPPCARSSPRVPPLTLAGLHGRPGASDGLGPPGLRQQAVLASGDTCSGPG